MRTNYGLGATVIHEVDHFTKWKNGLLQGNHPLIENMNEISAYKATAEWTGGLDSGVSYYLYDNEGDFKGIGFPVKKDGRYNVLVKIHTDSDKTWFYLNDKNKKLIMKNKVKLISEDFDLQRLILNVN